MSDIFTEQHLSISQIADILPPGPTGKKVNFSTVYRWIFRGVRSPAGQLVRLESVRVGGRWLVSREALQRFVEMLSVRSSDASPSPRSPAERRRKSAVAGKKLERMGI
jgi:hypothetical protein